jgi:hypothetical protein
VEALDLAVGARTVRLRLQVSDAVAGEELTDEPTPRVGPGIVGQQSLRSNAVPAAEDEGALEEANDSCGALVCLDSA